MDLETMFDCYFDIMTFFSWNCASCVVYDYSVVTEGPTQGMPYRRGGDRRPLSCVSFPHCMCVCLNTAVK